MKRIFFAFVLYFLVVNIACNKTADLKENSVGEQSIESSEGDKVLIRLKPNVGDTQKLKMVMDMTSTGSKTMDMKLNSNLEMKVTAKEDSVYVYDLLYKSLNMDMNVAGMQVSYNSDSPLQEGMGALLHEQMKAFIGKSFTMKMTDRGMVTDFSIPGNNSQQMGDLGSISIPLPKEAVGVGDTWTSTRKMENAGDLKMVMKVEKITVDDLLISTDGDIINDSGKSVGKFTGDYTLDRGNGFTKDGTMNLDLQMEGQPVKMKINFKGI